MRRKRLLLLLIILKGPRGAELVFLLVSLICRMYRAPVRAFVREFQGTPAMHHDVPVGHAGQCILIIAETSGPNDPG